MKSQSASNKFLNSLLLLTSLAGILTWLVAFYFLNREVPTSTWFLLASICILTYFVHRYLISANKKRPQLFVAAFMGSLTVKLFVSVGLIVIVRYADPDNFKFSAVSYAVYYLLFTFLEIKSILPLIRNSKG